MLHELFNLILSMQFRKEIVSGKFVKDTFLKLFNFFVELCIVLVTSICERMWLCKFLCVLLS